MIMPLFNESSKRIFETLLLVKKVDSPYSITERMVLELIPVLGSQPAGDIESKPVVGCHYFPP